MKKYVLLTINTLILGLAVQAQVLTLDSCKNLAVARNKTLKVAQMELEASQQVKKSAFTHYFPNVQAGGVSARFNENVIDTQIDPMNLPVYNGDPTTLATASQFAYVPEIPISAVDYMNVGYVAAVQPIFVGGRIYYGNKLAELGVDFKTDNLKLSHNEVMVKTEEYYWLVVSLQEKKNTLAKYKSLLQSLHKDVNNAFNAGLIKKQDVLKVELELNKIESQELQLQNGIVIMSKLLCQHIGEQYTEDFRLSHSEIIIEAPENFNSNSLSSVKNRTEYQMLEKAVEFEQLQTKMNRGEHLPSVAVGVQGLWLDAMETQQSNSILFATVSIPISDWWGGSYTHKEHKIKEKIALTNLNEKSELLTIQIEKAYQDLKEAYMQISIAEKAIDQTTEYVRVVNDNYEAGILGASDLLEAQALMQQKVDDLVDAKVQYKIRLVQFLSASAQL